MSNYVSAIAVDFGSSNSGCCRVCNFDNEKNLVFSNPEFIQNKGDYAKDNTWFYVEPSFLERIRTDYGSLKDEDFKILSRILSGTESPNIIWQRDVIRANGKKLKDEKWVSFRNFKMMLYHGDDNMAALDFPLLLIIKTFMRILKIECLYRESRRLGRQVDADEVLWGITIPSIWTDENKSVMFDIAHDVFSKQTRILSEPQGPLAYALLVNNEHGQVSFRNGRITLVVDMGGGTTDITVMKEVLQNDGSFKCEMVAQTDGSDAGGNDVDKDFYMFMLRNISKGKTSDDGISYDSLTDNDLFDKLFFDFQTDVPSFLAFDDEWNKLKTREDINERKELPFSFSSDYRKWLKSNGHSQIADVVGEYLLNGCQFDTEDFKNKVFVPTFDKICKTIKEFLFASCSNIPIDQVVLAGGMSCNNLLRGYVQETIKEVLGSSISRHFQDLGPLMSGGSIVAGSCYLLVHKDAMINLAVANYFYNARVSSVTDAIVSSYKERGVSMKKGEVSTLMDDEQEYNTGYMGSYSVLFPVMIKDSLVKPFYDEDLSTREDQTSLRFTFYSSDGKIVLFANEDNPDLTKLLEFSCECKPNTRYKLEVDANESQISNSLHVVLREYITNEIVMDDYIKDAIRNK